MLVTHNGQRYVIDDRSVVESSNEKVFLVPAEHYFDKIVNGVERKVLTAKAYDLLCAKAGISVIHSESILNSNGIRVANPEITFNRGVATSVRMQIYAFGRNEAGILTFVDLTINYNLDAYFANDLFKMAVTDTGWKDWAELVPYNSITVDPKKVLRVAVSPGLDLACNIDATEVIVAIREHQERCMYAERAALSMATRNAVSKLLGIKYAEVDEEGRAYVPLTIWQRSDMTMTEIQTACQNARDGKTVISGQVVTGIKDVLEISREDVQTEEDKAVTEPDTKPASEPASKVEVAVEQPKIDPKDSAYVQKVVEMFDGEILPTKEEDEGVRMAIRNALKSISQWSKNPKVIAALQEVGARDANDLSMRKTHADRKKFLELISAA